MAELLNIEQLKKLKKELPKGYYKILSSKTGLGQSFILNVFANKENDIEKIKLVINEALKLREKRLAEIAKLNEKLALK